MLGISDWIKLNWPFLAFGTVGVVGGFSFLYQKVILFRIFIDKLFISTPVIKDVVKTLYMYKFANLLSQFYEAGVSPVVSLKLLGNIFENFHYKQKMIDVRSDLESGFTLYDSLASCGCNRRYHRSFYLLTNGKYDGTSKPNVVKTTPLQ